MAVLTKNLVQNLMDLVFSSKNNGVVRRLRVKDKKESVKRPSRNIMQTTRDNSTSLSLKKTPFL